MPSMSERELLNRTNQYRRKHDNSHSRTVIAIHSGRSTDFVITKLERAFVGPVTTVPNATNALSATTGTLGADRVPAITKGVNRSNATGHCAIVTNSASVNAR